MTRDRTSDSTAEEPEQRLSDAANGRAAILWLFPSVEPRVTWLTAEKYSLGRDETCSVSLPGTLISRRHARLERTKESWAISDEGSRNGINVNGQTVRSAELRPGDVLRVGEWVGLLTTLPEGAEPTYGEIVAGFFGGPDLKKLSRFVEIAVASDLTVVLEGPTGTGKEQLARAIHDKSRGDGPFVAVNCALYNTSTAVAELFGYRKGAFTGAERTYPGLIRSAEGGTLLLDEVTDLQTEVQAQLLRVLETHEVASLGEARPLHVNVRFLAATQEPLAAAVARGRFRDDLRARLEGLVIRLPALRDRRGDASRLFMHLLATHSKDAPPAVEPKLFERLCLYPWPLNVREVVSMVRRLVAAYGRESELTLRQALAVCPELGPDAPSFPPPPPGATPTTTEPTVLNDRQSTLPDADTDPDERLERRAFDPEEAAALRAAVERNGGNLTRAALDLNMTRGRAYRILRALDARSRRRTP